MIAAALAPEGTSAQQPFSVTHKQLIITFVAYRLKLNLAATASLQLLVVLAVARRQGFWPATLVSLFANCCMNYYFVPPLFSLYVSDLQNWVALGVFEISALVFSRLSTQAQQQAERAAAKERESEQLCSVSRGLLVLNRHTPPGPQILMLLNRTYAVVRAVLWDFSSTRVDVLGEDIAPLKDATMAAYLQDRDPPSSTDNAWIRVLRLGVRPIGALGIQGGELTAISANALASLVAIALERTRSFEREMHAEAERKSEQLRTAVLDALAHDYKTPLTTLRTAAAGLLEIGGLQSEQRELLSLIDSEVERLGNLTTRLLQTSRLDTADVRIRPEKIDPDELVQSVISGMRDVLKGHAIHIKALEKGATVKADRELAGMAIAQFLDKCRQIFRPCQSDNRLG